MEENSQILKDRELLKEGWVALYLGVLGHKEGEYELPCIFTIGSSVGIRCKARDLEVFSNSSYDMYVWTPPGVGYTEAVDAWFSKNVVKTEEVKGRLRRYRYGDLFIIELRVHNVLMLEIWRGDERLFTRTIWLSGSDAANGAVVARLLKEYLPIDLAIDLTTHILCNGCDREELKRSIIAELVAEYLEFPDTPLAMAVRFGNFVEKVEGLKSQHLDVRHMQDAQYGEVTLITAPAACNYYNIWLRGGRRALALLCTANKPSHKPRDSVIEIDGVYLTETPLRLSYFDDGVARCADVGDKCLPIINHLIDEEGLAIERSSGIAKLKIIETQRYKAYYIDIASALTRLLILEAGGKVLGIAAGNVDEAKEKIRDVVYQLNDREIIDAVENALMYIERHV